ncbi:MAG: hypothetical protein M1837_003643 [Sclerophora amabilis]|nr:MAG: hypothetical protein M1837_003643 [Sclerophora amabilis]
MFDIFAKLLSSLATFLFPVFASYKALKGHDPAELSPWLMYWVVLACLLLVESWTEWLLVWFPFYQWIRAFVLLYLVLPQTQGAAYLYQTHIHPFLATHETEIDNFISSAHDRARAAGLQYLKNFIELVKVHVFGLQKSQDQRPPSPRQSSNYAQSLLARFNLPSARNGPVGGGTASDFYALLASTLGQTLSSGSSASANPDAQAATLSASGTLIPPSIRGRDARMSYISAQRERLGVLMRALDKEATSLISPLPSGPSGDGVFSAGHATTTLPGALSGESDEYGTMGRGLQSRKSEMDFEKVERDEIAGGDGNGNRGETTEGGWMPWNWGGSKRPATGTTSTTAPSSSGQGSSQGKDTTSDAPSTSTASTTGSDAF